MFLFLLFLTTKCNCGVQNISNLFKLLYCFCQILCPLDKHCSPHFPVIYLFKLKSRLLTSVLGWSLINICVLSLVVWRSVLLEFDDAGISQWTNLRAAISSSPGLYFLLCFAAYQLCGIFPFPLYSEAVWSLWPSRCAAKVVFCIRLEARLELP